MTRPDHKPRPRVYAGKPFAHFQWNYGWGVWEQVIPEAAGKRGVVTAYAPPAERGARGSEPSCDEGNPATDEPKPPQNPAGEGAP